MDDTTFRQEFEAKLATTPLGFPLLYGSRKFHNMSTAESDWDFAVRDVRGAEWVLATLGFEKKPEFDYRDCSTISVWDKVDVDEDGNKRKIQVSIRMEHYWEAFCALWKNMPEELYSLYICKRGPYYRGGDELSTLVSNLTYLMQGNIIVGWD